MFKQPKINVHSKSVSTSSIHHNEAHLASFGHFRLIPHVGGLLWSGPSWHTARYQPQILSRSN